MTDERVDRLKSIKPEDRYWWQQVIVDQAEEIDRLKLENAALRTTIQDVY